MSAYGGGAVHRLYDDGPTCTDPKHLEVRRDSPPERATRLGHAVSWDPPFGSNTERWTCSACGRAVLRHRGNVYGSAVEVECGS